MLAAPPEGGGGAEVPGGAGGVLGELGVGREPDGGEPPGAGVPAATTLTASFIPWEQWLDVGHIKYLEPAPGKGIVVGLGLWVLLGFPVLQLS